MLLIWPLTHDRFASFWRSNSHKILTSAPTTGPPMLVKVWHWESSWDLSSGIERQHESNLNSWTIQSASRITSNWAYTMKYHLVGFRSGMGEIRRLLHINPVSFYEGFYSLLQLSYFSRLWPEPKRMMLQRSNQTPWLLVNILIEFIK